MAEIMITWEGDRAPFAKAFVAAQKATESVKKAATNPHFKSKYADLAEVVEAVVPALNAQGIGVMQFPSFDGTLTGVTTVFIHESGSSVTGTLHLNPTKQDPQGVGSAITYARRYSLLAMTGAAPEDDDANAASGPRQNPKPPTLTERATGLFKAIANAPDRPAVEKVWALGSGLCAELDAKAPETLADLERAYQNKLDSLLSTPFDEVA
jgi:hypothetical protein